MTERKCETCRHWGHDADGKPTGHGDYLDRGWEECPLILRGAHDMTDLDDIDNCALLLTSPHFHCALWAEEDPPPQDETVGMSLGVGQSLTITGPASFVITGKRIASQLSCSGVTNAGGVSLVFKGREEVEE